MFLSANPKNGFLILDLPDFATETQEREIPNWILTLVTFRVKSVTASQERMCYLLFDELCDDTMQNFVIGYSNSGVGAEWITEKQASSGWIYVEGYTPWLSAQFRALSRPGSFLKENSPDQQSGFGFAERDKPYFSLLSFSVFWKKKSGEQSIAINKHKRL